MSEFIDVVRRFVLWAGCQAQVATFLALVEPAATESPLFLVVSQQRLPIFIPYPDDSIPGITQCYLSIGFPNLITGRISADDERITYWPDYGFLESLNEIKNLEARQRHGEETGMLAKSLGGIANIWVMVK